MGNFSVIQLARLAGVSVRALHHYDQIGLLKPLVRSESKYRYYGKNELIKLQQILFYKELDFSLSQIAEILSDPEFDTLAALESHKKELRGKKKYIDGLIETINHTIVQLKSNEKMNYEEMYKGFSKQQIEAYEKEGTDRWGAKIMDESKQRIAHMTKERVNEIKLETENINTSLLAVMHLPVEDKKVQEQVQRHFTLLGNYYTVTSEIYQGLAEMYVIDERFSAYYEKYGKGLATFLSKAMMYYCYKL